MAPPSFSFVFHSRACREPAFPALPVRQQSTVGHYSLLLRITKRQNPIRLDHSVCLPVISHINLQDLLLSGLLRFAGFILSVSLSTMQKKKNLTVWPNSYAGHRSLAPLTSGHTKDFASLLGFSQHNEVFYRSLVLDQESEMFIKTWQTPLL